MNGLSLVHVTSLNARLSENRQSFVKLVKTDPEKEESGERVKGLYIIPLDYL